MALNRILSIHINHTKFFQAPLEIMTQSARDALGDKVDSMYSFAGRRITFPDAVWQRANGNPIAFYNPPPINESYVRMYELLAAEFERISLHTTAMQGNSDPHAQSGRAIGLLQSAAQNVITYRAIWAERALSTLARVTIPMIADFLDEDGWKHYTSKYPPAILAAIQSRAKNIEYDINVEIEAGKGSLQRQRFQDALMLRSATGGLMPSLRTLLERSGEYDTEDEMNRVAQEQGAAAQARQTQAAAAGGKPTPSQ
jgi:hypothetical protein